MCYTVPCNRWDRGLGTWDSNMAEHSIHDAYISNPTHCAGDTSMERIDQSPRVHKMSGRLKWVEGWVRKATAAGKCYKEAMLWWHQKVCERASNTVEHRARSLSHQDHDRLILNGTALYDSGASLQWFFIARGQEDKRGANADTFHGFVPLHFQTAIIYLEWDPLHDLIGWWVQMLWVCYWWVPFRHGIENGLYVCQC